MLKENAENPVPSSVERRLQEWGIRLNSEQQATLGSYLEEVLKYNSKVRLTAGRSAKELWRRHVADSLAPLACLKSRFFRSAAPQVADVGSGAGFAGVAIQVAWPESRVTLFESNYKKFQFLSWVTARLKLSHMRVVWRRVGPQRKEKGFDVVVERALAPFLEAAGICLPLCRAPGGIWVAYQSDRKGADGLSVLEWLGRYKIDSPEIIPYRLPEENRDRYLALIRRSPDAAA